MEEENKIIVSCQVDGTPKPKINWKKGNQEIVPSDTIQMLYDEQTGDVVLMMIDVPIELIQPIVYKIEVENDFGKAISEAEVMQIVQPPDVSLPPFLRAPLVTPLKAKTIPDKSTLILRSSYTGRPEPNIKWLKNGKELFAIDDENVDISTENGITTLTVQNVDRKRAGKYEIVATNEIGESKASASIRISDDEPADELLPPQFIEPLQPKTVLLNEEVVIFETVVQSNPESSFQWFFNSTPIAQSEFKRIHVQNNRSILYIERFTSECQGLYTCRAENVCGSVTTSATVIIVDSEEQLEERKEYLSPRFIQKLKPIHLMDGEALKLTCRIVGNPIPKIAWFHNKHMLTPNKGVIIIQDVAGVCELHMPEVFVEDEGCFSCKAVNKFGKATTKTNVAIEGIVILSLNFVLLCHLLCIVAEQFWSFL